MAATSSLTTLLYLLVAGLAFGHGGGAQRSEVQPSVGQTAVHRSYDPRLRGEWVATGRVLGAYGVEGRSTGEVLNRRWLFGAACQAGRCQTKFSRTSSGDEIQHAMVRVHRGFYTAGFPRIPDGCEERPGWVADFTGRFRIRWSKDGGELVAVETGFFRGGGGCGPAGERIRWTATRRYGSPSEGAQEVL